MTILSLKMKVPNEKYIDSFDQLNLHINNEESADGGAEIALKMNERNHTTEKCSIDDIALWSKTAHLMQTANPKQLSLI